MNRSTISVLIAFAVRSQKEHDQSEEDEVEEASEDGDEEEEADRQFQQLSDYFASNYTYKTEIVQILSEKVMAGGRSGRRLKGSSHINPRRTRFSRHSPDSLQIHGNRTIIALPVGAIFSSNHRMV
jgi:hypothetical protein